MNGDSRSFVVGERVATQRVEERMPARADDAGRLSFGGTPSARIQGAASGCTRVGAAGLEAPAPPVAMPEVEAVRTHPRFQECSARLEDAETDREFCRHQLPHLLDVARIAYVRVLERRLPFRKEVVYAAALLHDIGKAAQYEEGEPHEVAGARIAQEILQDVEGFDPREKTMIVAAVAQHRRWSSDSTPLGRLLYEADKASRACFACPARAACTWPDERKNWGVAV